MKIHKVDGKIQNIFIAEYPDKLLLLDGACRSDYSTVKYFIENNLSRKISDLKLIAVTHMHPDHAGSAGIFRKKHNIPIAAFNTCDLWYAGVGGKIQHSVDTALAYYVAFKKRKYSAFMKYSPKLKPDFYLKDNDILPFFPDWQVIHTPGHTSHDICLFCAARKTLYAADLIIEINNSFHLPFPVVFPEIMAQSLMKIRKFNVQILLLAHGNAIINNNFEIMIDNVLQKVFKKKEGLFAFLQYFVKFTKCAKNFEKIYKHK